jgi:hypothetical protein
MMRLKQAQGLPFKTGLRHPEGMAAFVFGNHLLIKSIALIEDAVYPDMGSNFETFTNADFLELETLGPLKTTIRGERPFLPRKAGSDCVPPSGLLRDAHAEPLANPARSAPGWGTAVVIGKCALGSLLPKFALRKISCRFRRSNTP